jgi:MFS family permease
MILAAFLLDFSVAVGLTAMPFFIVERIHGGAALSGSVGAIQMGLYAVGCLVSSRFVSSARNGLYWALGGVGFFALLFSSTWWAHDSVTCVLLSTLPFIGLALAWPAMQSWLGQEPDLDVRARHLAGFNMATAFGFTLSPLVTGPLYDADFRLPFFLLLALCVGVVALILSLMTGRTHAAAEEEASEGVASESFSRGLLYASWAATFTANGLFAAVRSVYPVRVEALVREGSLNLIGSYRPAAFDAVGAATAYSWLAFLLSLCTVLCFAVLGRTKAWQGRYWVLGAGQLAAGTAFVVLGYAHSLVAMAACFAVLGANCGLCFFASLYYSLAEAEGRHRRAAVNEGLLGAGGFAGGIGLGYATEWFGITAALQWGICVVLLAVAVQYFLLHGVRYKVAR